ncbi:AAA family ATPase, partial [Elusimicrobiota bacterium]
MKLLNSIYVKITSWILVISFVFVYVLSDYSYALDSSQSHNTQKKHTPVELPLEYGKVVQRYREDIPGPRVILIQDLHANYETQRNIMEILKILDSNCGISRLGVEGSSSDIDTSFISTIPDNNIRDDIVRYFMGKGMITGAEAYSIHSNKPVLEGLEDSLLYKKNSRLLVSSLNNRRQFVQILERIKYLLKKTEPKACSSELSTFRTHYVLYRQKNLELIAFHKYLQQWAAKTAYSIPESSINYWRFMELTRRSQELDYRKASDEYEKLLKDLDLKYDKEKGPGSALKLFKNFFRVPEDIRTRMTESIYSGRKYKNLREYLDCIELSRQIDTYNTILDEDRIVSDITDRLCRNRTERDFMYVSRYMDLLVKFLLNQMTPAELETFYSGSDNFLAHFTELEDKYTQDFSVIGELLVSLQPYIEEMGLFYGVARERDEGFVKHILDGNMKGNTVLVTGGFHSYGISKLLKEQAIPHLVIKPVVTRHTEEDRSRYYSFIRGGELLSYEDVLSLTLAPESFLPKSWFRRRIAARVAGNILRDKLNEFGYSSQGLNKITEYARNFISEWGRAHTRLDMELDGRKLDLKYRIRESLLYDNIPVFELDLEGKSLMLAFEGSQLKAKVLSAEVSENIRNELIRDRFIKLDRELSREGSYINLSHQNRMTVAAGRVMPVSELDKLISSKNEYITLNIATVEKVLKTLKKINPQLDVVEVQGKYYLYDSLLLKAVLSGSLLFEPDRKKYEKDIGRYLKETLQDPDKYAVLLEDRRVIKEGIDLTAGFARPDEITNTGRIIDGSNEDIPGDRKKIQSGSEKRIKLIIKSARALTMLISSLIISMYTWLAYDIVKLRHSFLDLHGYDNIADALTNLSMTPVFVGIILSYAVFLLMNTFTNIESGHDKTAHPNRLGSAIRDINRTIVPILLSLTLTVPIGAYFIFGIKSAIFSGSSGTAFTFIMSQNLAFFVLKRIYSVSRNTISPKVTQNILHDTTLTENESAGTSENIHIRKTGKKGSIKNTLKILLIAAITFSLSLLMPAKSIHAFFMSKKQTNAQIELILDMEVPWQGRMGLASNFDRLAREEDKARLVRDLYKQLKGHVTREEVEQILDPDKAESKHYLNIFFEYSGNKYDSDSGHIKLSGKHKKLLKEFSKAEVRHKRFYGSSYDLIDFQAINDIAIIETVLPLMFRHNNIQMNELLTEEYFLKWRTALKELIDSSDEQSNNILKVLSENALKMTIVPEAFKELVDKAITEKNDTYKENVNKQVTGSNNENKLIFRDDFKEQLQMAALDNSIKQQLWVLYAESLKNESLSAEQKIALLMIISSIHSGITADVLVNYISQQTDWQFTEQGVKALSDLVMGLKHAGRIDAYFSSDSIDRTLQFINRALINAGRGDDTYIASSLALMQLFLHMDNPAVNEFLFNIVRNEKAAVSRGTVLFAGYILSEKHSLTLQQIELLKKDFYKFSNEANQIAIILTLSEYRESTEFIQDLLKLYAYDEKSTRQIHKYLLYALMRQSALGDISEPDIKDSTVAVLMDHIKNNRIDISMDITDNAYEKQLLSFDARDSLFSLWINTPVLLGRIYSMAIVEDSGRIINMIKKDDFDEHISEKSSSRIAFVKELTEGKDTLTFEDMEEIARNSQELLEEHGARKYFIEGLLSDGRLSPEHLKRFADTQSDAEPHAFSSIAKYMLDELGIWQQAIIDIEQMKENIWKGQEYNPQIWVNWMQDNIIQLWSKYEANKKVLEFTPIAGLWLGKKIFDFRYRSFLDQMNAGEASKRDIYTRKAVNYMRFISHDDVQKLSKMQQAMAFVEDKGRYRGTIFLPWELLNSPVDIADLIESDIPHESMHYIRMFTYFGLDIADIYLLGASSRSFLDLMYRILSKNNRDIMSVVDDVTARVKNFPDKSADELTAEISAEVMMEIEKYSHQHFIDSYRSYISEYIHGIVISVKNPKQNVREFFIDLLGKDFIDYKNVKDLPWKKIVKDKFRTYIWTESVFWYTAFGFRLPWFDTYEKGSRQIAAVSTRVSYPVKYPGSDEIFMGLFLKGVPPAKAVFAAQAVGLLMNSANWEQRQEIIAQIAGKTHIKPDRLLEELIQDEISLRLKTYAGLILDGPLQLGSGEIIEFGKDAVFDDIYDAAKKLKEEFSSRLRSDSPYQQSIADKVSEQYKSKKKARFAGEYEMLPEPIISSRIIAQRDLKIGHEFEIELDIDIKLEDHDMNIYPPFGYLGGFAIVSVDQTHRSGRYAGYKVALRTTIRNTFGEIEIPPMHLRVYKPGSDKSGIYPVPLGSVKLVPQIPEGTAGKLKGIKSNFIKLIPTFKSAAQAAAGVLLLVFFSSFIGRLIGLIRRRDTGRSPPIKDIFNEVVTQISLLEQKYEEGTISVEDFYGDLTGALMAFINDFLGIKIPLWNTSIFVKTIKQLNWKDGDNHKDFFRELISRSNAVRFAGNPDAQQITQDIASSRNFTSALKDRKPITSAKKGSSLKTMLLTSLFSAVFLLSAATYAYAQDFGGYISEFITFKYPQLLYGGSAAAALFYFIKYFKNKHDRRKAALLYPVETEYPAAKRKIRRSDPGIGFFRKAAPAAINFMVIINMILTMGFPQLGTKNITDYKEGKDIVIVYDISSSVRNISTGETEEDSLYGLIVKSIIDFIDTHRKNKMENRIALVRCGTYAYVAMSLTDDYTGLIDQMKQPEITDGGTSFGESFALGLNHMLEMAILDYLKEKETDKPETKILNDEIRKNLFTEGGMQTILEILESDSAMKKAVKDKMRGMILLLVSDGDNTSGKIEPMDVAYQAKELGVQVYCIAPVDDKVEDRKLIDIETMKAISELTVDKGKKGFFFSNDTEGLAKAFLDISRSNFKLIPKDEVVFDDATWQFALISLALFFLKLGIDRARLRALMMIFFAFSIATGGNAGKLTAANAADAAAGKQELSQKAATEDTLTEGFLLSTRVKELEEGNIYFNKAYNALRSRDKKSARKLFNKAKRLYGLAKEKYPDLMEPAMNEACVFALNGDIQYAVTTLDSIIKEAQARLVPYTSEHVQWRRGKMPDFADNEYIMDLISLLSYAYYNHAFIKISMGVTDPSQMQDIIDIYMSALQADPHNIDASNNLEVIKKELEKKKSDGKKKKGGKEKSAKRQGSKKSGDDKKRADPDKRNNKGSRPKRSDYKPDGKKFTFSDLVLVREKIKKLPEFSKSGDIWGIILLAGGMLFANMFLGPAAAEASDGIMQRFSEIEFSRQWLLYFIAPAMALTAGLSAAVLKKAYNDAKKHAPGRVPEKLRQWPRLRKFIFRLLFVMIIPALFIIAAAGPKSGIKQDKISGLSTHIIFDITYSNLLAEETIGDHLISRRAEAVRELEKILDNSDGSNLYGLIISAGTAKQEAPLTDNLKDFREYKLMILKHDPARMQGKLTLFDQDNKPVNVKIETTDIAQGLYTAINSFRISTGVTKENDKIILYVGDGEGIEITDELLNAIRLVRDDNIRIFVLGTGKLTSKMPLRDKEGNITGYINNRFQVPADSTPNHEVLKEIARLGAGEYTHVRDGNIIELLKKAAKESTNKQESSRGYEKNESLPALIAAFLIYLITALISDSNFYTREEDSDEDPKESGDSSKITKTGHAAGKSRRSSSISGIILGIPAAALLMFGTDTYAFSGPVLEYPLHTWISILPWGIPAVMILFFVWLRKGLGWQGLASAERSISAKTRYIRFRKNMENNIRDIFTDLRDDKDDTLKIISRRDLKDIDVKGTQGKQGVKDFYTNWRKLKHKKKIASIRRMIESPNDLWIEKILTAYLFTNDKEIEDTIEDSLRRINKPIHKKDLEDVLKHMLIEKNRKVAGWTNEPDLTLKLLMIWYPESGDKGALMVLESLKHHRDAFVREIAKEKLAAIGIYETEKQRASFTFKRFFVVLITTLAFFISAGIIGIATVKYFQRNALRSQLMHNDFNRDFGKYSYILKSNYPDNRIKSEIIPILKYYRHAEYDTAFFNAVEYLPKSQDPGALHILLAFLANWEDVTSQPEEFISKVMTALERKGTARIWVFDKYIKENLHIADHDTFVKVLDSLKKIVLNRADPDDRFAKEALTVIIHAMRHSNQAIAMYAGDTIYEIATRPVEKTRFSNTQLKLLLENRLLTEVPGTGSDVYWTTYRSIEDDLYEIGFKESDIEEIMTIFRDTADHYAAVKKLLSRVLVDFENDPDTLARFSSYVLTHQDANIADMMGAVLWMTRNKPEFQSHIFNWYVSAGKGSAGKTVLTKLRILLSGRTHLGYSSLSDQPLRGFKETRPMQNIRMIHPMHVPKMLTFIRGLQKDERIGLESSFMLIGDPNIRNDVFSFLSKCGEAGRLEIAKLATRDKDTSRIFGTNSIIGADAYTYKYAHILNDDYDPALAVGMINFIRESPDALTRKIYLDFFGIFRYAHSHLDIARLYPALDRLSSKDRPLYEKCMNSFFKNPDDKILIFKDDFPKQIEMSSLDNKRKKNLIELYEKYSGSAAMMALESLGRSSRPGPVIGFLENADRSIQDKAADILHNRMDKDKVIKALVQAIIKSKQHSYMRVMKDKYLLTQYAILKRIFSDPVPGSSVVKMLVDCDIKNTPGVLEALEVISDYPDTDKASVNIILNALAEQGLGGYCAYFISNNDPAVQEIVLDLTADHALQARGILVDKIIELSSLKINSMGGPVIRTRKNPPGREYHNFERLRSYQNLTTDPVLAAKTIDILKTSEKWDPQDIQALVLLMKDMSYGKTLPHVKKAIMNLKDFATAEDIIEGIRLVAQETIYYHLPEMNESNAISHALALFLLVPDLDVQQEAIKQLAQRATYQTRKCYDLTNLFQELSTVILDDIAADPQSAVYRNIFGKLAPDMIDLFTIPVIKARAVEEGFWTTLRLEVLRALVYLKDHADDTVRKQVSKKADQIFKDLLNEMSKKDINNHILDKVKDNIEDWKQWYPDENAAVIETLIEHPDKKIRTEAYVKLYNIFFQLKDHTDKPHNIQYTARLRSLDNRISKQDTISLLDEISTGDAWPHVTVAQHFKDNPDPEIRSEAYNALYSVTIHLTMNYKQDMRRKADAFLNDLDNSIPEDDILAMLGYLKDKTDPNGWNIAVTLYLSGSNNARISSSAKEVLDISMQNIQPEELTDFLKRILYFLEHGKNDIEIKAEKIRSGLNSTVSVDTLRSALKKLSEQKFTDIDKVKIMKILSENPDTDVHSEFLLLYYRTLMYVKLNKILTSLADTELFLIHNRLEPEELLGILGILSRQDNWNETDMALIEFIAESHDKQVSSAAETLLEKITESTKKLSGIMYHQKVPREPAPAKDDSDLPPGTKFLLGAAAIIGKRKRDLKIPPEIASNYRKVEFFVNSLINAFAHGGYKAAFLGRDGSEVVDMVEDEEGVPTRDMARAHYAKTGEIRRNVKREEKDLPGMMILDVSDSRKLNTLGISTGQVMDNITGGLAMAVHYQKQSLGLITVADEVKKYIPLGNSLTHRDAVLREIWNKDRGVNTAGRSGIPKFIYLLLIPVILAAVLSGISFMFWGGVTALLGQYGINADINTAGGIIAAISVLTLIAVNAVIQAKMQKTFKISGVTDLGKGIDLAVKALRRRSLVVLVTDGISRDFEPALAKLKLNRHIVVPIIVEDKSQIYPPKAGVQLMLDPETGRIEEQNTSDEKWRIRHIKKHEDNKMRLTELFKRYGYDPVFVEISKINDKDYFKPVLKNIKNRMNRRVSRLNYLLSHTLRQSIEKELSVLRPEVFNNVMGHLKKEGLSSLQGDGRSYELTISRKLLEVVSTVLGVSRSQMEVSVKAHEYAHAAIDLYFESKKITIADYDKFIKHLESSALTEKFIPDLIKEHLRHDKENIPIGKLAQRYTAESVVKELIATLFSYYFEGRGSPLVSERLILEYSGSFEELSGIIKDFYPALHKRLGLKKFQSYHEPPVVSGLPFINRVLLKDPIKIRDSLSRKKEILSKLKKHLKRKNIKINEVTDEELDNIFAVLKEELSYAPRSTVKTDPDFIKLHKLMRDVEDEVSKVVKGQKHVIRSLLIGLLVSKGHILIEGMPGMGKTLAASTIIKLIRDGGDLPETERARAARKELLDIFMRVQVTSDLQPYDFTGVNIFKEKLGDFIFKHGPVFTILLLADEINRAPAKTVSALLEAMQEMQVTVDGEPYFLDELFTVIGTKNPLELEGTYPLPEASIDRFFIEVMTEYGSYEDGLEMVAQAHKGGARAIEINEGMIELGDISKVRKIIEKTFVDDTLIEYIADIVRATRNPGKYSELAGYNDYLINGVSVRGGQALVKAAKAHAFLNARSYVIPSDIKKMVPFVLAHRIVLSQGNPKDLLSAILEVVEPSKKLEDAARWDVLIEFEESIRSIENRLFEAARHIIPDESELDIADIHIRDASALLEKADDNYAILKTTGKYERLLKRHTTLKKRLEYLKNHIADNRTEYDRMLKLEEDYLPDDAKEHIKEVRSTVPVIRKMEDEIAKVIIGQKDMVRKLLIGLLVSRGHILISGMPGLAKTLLVSTVARLIKDEEEKDPQTAAAAKSELKTIHKRIQMTYDVQPYDIIGTKVLKKDINKFVIKYGPVFSVLLLVDEINRATPKTQAALLEAMQELQVTIDGEPFDLSDLFTVIATQNPVDQEGTYPLPEAQLDRFLMKIIAHYPSSKEEIDIIRQAHKGGAESVSIAEGMITLDQIRHIRSVIEGIYVDESLLYYIVDIVRASRPKDDTFIEGWKEDITLGGSPRAVQALLRAAKAHAFMYGRGYILAEDIKAVAHDVLRHRISLEFSSEKTADEFIDQILDKIKAPDLKRKKYIDYVNQYLNRANRMILRAGVETGIYDRDELDESGKLLEKAEKLIGHIKEQIHKDTERGNARKTNTIKKRLYRMNSEITAVKNELDKRQKELDSIEAEELDRLDGHVKEHTIKVRKALKLVKEMEAETGKIIKGQKYMIRRVLMALLSRKGHILIEGMPGLAKTLLIHTISRLIDTDDEYQETYRKKAGEELRSIFKKIQMTYDIEPYDILGQEVFIDTSKTDPEGNFKTYSQQKIEKIREDLQDELKGKVREFIKRGPVFTVFLLVDEINRARPKAQSALLEAMEEQQVTIGKKTYILSELFTVFATQNPVEQEGTYELDPAKVDRFFMYIKAEYPDYEDEVEIGRLTHEGGS